MTEAKKSDRDCDDLPTVIEQPGDAVSAAYRGSIHSEVLVVVEVTPKGTTPESRVGWTRHGRRLTGIVGSLAVLAMLLVGAGSIAFLRPGIAPTPRPAPSVRVATSTAFVLPPNSAAWSDTARRVVLVYPTAWKKAVPSDSMLRLTARDGTTFLLYDTNFNRSPMDGIAAVQRAHAAETASDGDPDLATRDYTDGATSDIRIGDELANEMPYTSVSKLMPAQPARRGEVLTVTHAGSQYAIQVEYGSTGGNADVAGVIASIRFIEPPLPA